MTVFARRRTAWIVAVLLALAFSPTICRGQAAVAKSPPGKAPTHYLGRQIAATMHYEGAPWLVRESRQREEDCRRLLKELEIRPGQTVCDLGCGNGFYTLRLARLVGAQGKVYAVDIQPEMIEMLKDQAARAKLANIEPLVGGEADPRLPAASCDLILLVDVYHELSRPEEMLRAIRGALKPTGRLVLAEFRAEDPNVPIQPLHKMSKQQVLRELEPNGFRLVRQFDGLPWQHLMFFEALPKPEGVDSGRVGG